MRKTIILAAVLSVAIVGVGVSVGTAANPHGQKSDPNASCGHHQGTGKPSGQCNDKGLPQSNGCNPNSSPHNPHCQLPPTTPTTPTPTTPKQGVTNGPKEPGSTPEANRAARRAQAVVASPGNEALQTAQLGG